MGATNCGVQLILDTYCETISIGYESLSYIVIAVMGSFIHLLNKCSNAPTVCQI